MKLTISAIATFATLATIFILSGCTKHESFVNIEYNCECGTLSVDGRELNVRLAEGFTPSEETPNVWRYHVVADYRTADEIANHAPSQDIAFTVELTAVNASTTTNAVGAITAIDISAQDIDTMWEIAGGQVTAQRTDSLHTVVFSNVSTGDNTIINADLTIVPQ
jgi:hypothetical protein